MARVISDVALLVVAGGFIFLAAALLMGVHSEKTAVHAPILLAIGLIGLFGGGATFLGVKLTYSMVQGEYSEYPVSTMKCAERKTGKHYDSVIRIKTNGQTYDVETDDIRIADRDYVILKEWSGLSTATTLYVSEASAKRLGLR